MKLKITGRVYATLEEVTKELIVDMANNVELTVGHSDEFVIVGVQGEPTIFEKDSLTYEIIQ